MSEAWLEGNQVELLESGAEFFPALIAAIDAAREDVHLETYIFARDATGRAVATALARAAERGVRVRLMVDGFGGRDFVSDTLPELAAAGVAVLVYRREIRALSFRRHRLRRLHRKLAVIDRRIAFVGGINIIDDMHTPNHVPPRYDYAVRVEGPLLAPIHAAVSDLWHLVSWANFRRRPKRHDPPRPHTQSVGRRRASFLQRDNLRHRNDIEDAYLEAIAAARSEIVIAVAYFLPGRRFRNALVEAAQRGVDVVLLLQGRVEYMLLHYATRALYAHLLTAGIRIVEYRRSFLHAKVAVVDRRWATVGSSNIDPFSLLCAREANVAVDDPGFAEELRSSLLRAMERGAVELRAHDWQRQPWYRRAASWLAFGLVRSLMGLAGYGGKH